MSAKSDTKQCMKMIHQMMKCLDGEDLNLLQVVEIVSGVLFTFLSMTQKDLNTWPESRIDEVLELQKNIIKLLISNGRAVLTESKTTLDA